MRRCCLRSILDFKIKIWKVPGAEANVEDLDEKDMLLATLTHHINVPVNCVRWSPDGRFLASCADDAAVCLSWLAPGPSAAAFGQAVKNVENWRCSNSQRKHSSGLSFIAPFAFISDFIIILIRRS